MFVGEEHGRSGGEAGEHIAQVLVLVECEGEPFAPEVVAPGQLPQPDAHLSRFGDAAVARFEVALRLILFLLRDAVRIDRFLVEGCRRPDRDVADQVEDACDPETGSGRTRRAARRPSSPIRRPLRRSVRPASGSGWTETSGCVEESS